MDYEVNNFIKKSCTNCGFNIWIFPNSFKENINYDNKYFCDKLCGTSYLIKYDKIFKVKKKNNSDNDISNNLQIYGTLSRKSF